MQKVTPENHSGFFQSEIKQSKNFVFSIFAENPTLAKSNVYFFKDKQRPAFFINNSLKANQAYCTCLNEKQK